VAFGKQGNSEDGAFASQCEHKRCQSRASRKRESSSQATHIESPSLIESSTRAIPCCTCFAGRAYLSSSREPISLITHRAHAKKRQVMRHENTSKMRSSRRGGCLINQEVSSARQTYVVAGISREAFNARKLSACETTAASRYKDTHRVLLGHAQTLQGHAPISRHLSR
jgi:hypothetical protein